MFHFNKADSTSQIIHSFFLLAKWKMLFLWYPIDKNISIHIFQSNGIPRDMNWIEIKFPNGEPFVIGELLLEIENFVSKIQTQRNLLRKQFRYTENHKSINNRWWYSWAIKK